METTKLNEVLLSAVAALEEVAAVASQEFLDNDQNTLELSIKVNEFVRYLNSHISFNQPAISKRL